MNDTNILISTNATNNYEYINQKTTPPPYKQRVRRSGLFVYMFFSYCAAPSVF